MVSIVISKWGNWGSQRWDSLSVITAPVSEWPRKDNFRLILISLGTTLFAFPIKWSVCVCTPLCTFTGMMLLQTSSHSCPVPALSPKTLMARISCSSCFMSVLCPVALFWAPFHRCHGLSEVLRLWTIQRTGDFVTCDPNTALWSPQNYTTEKEPLALPAHRGPGVQD